MKNPFSPLAAVNVGKTAPKRRRADKEVRVDPERVHQFIDKLIGDDFHAKRVHSLANAVTGVLHAASLGIHAIGRGLAAARGLNTKHATKQVDRLLSNSAFDMTRLLAAWIRFVVGARREIVVALDWTEFDKDDQSVIALYLVTNHGRATPLVWKSVKKSTLKNKRNGYEDEVIDTLYQALSGDVEVTLLADRGFGDVKLYTYLDSLSWNYVVRFREAIHVEKSGKTLPAREWLHASGRARKLVGVKVTGAKHELPAVVLVHDKKMKDAWCLATSLSESSASAAVKLYGRRFTIEETFRDTKDIHLGMGLSATHIKSTERRQRLLLLAAIAHSLLTMLGAAGEACGLDRTLKVNTSKKRSLSLYRQGCFWYDAIPMMKNERFVLLMNAFEKVVREQALFGEIYGII